MYFGTTPAGGQGIKRHTGAIKTHLKPLRICYDLASWPSGQPWHCSQVKLHAEAPFTQMCSRGKW